MCLCVEVLHDVTRIPVDEDPSLQLEYVRFNLIGFKFNIVKRNTVSIFFS